MKSQQNEERVLEYLRQEGDRDHFWLNVRLLMKSGLVEIDDAIDVTVLFINSEN